MTPIPKPNVHPPVRPFDHASERAVLAFGSNLGDRAGTIRAAIDALDARDDTRVTAVSDLIETVAVKPDGRDSSAPAYLNGIVLIRTGLGPHALLDVTAELEHEHGRTRTERWGDRTLDIDIVAYGHRRIADDRLTVPHPRAAERDFVLRPWLSVDPDAELPGVGRVADLLAALEASGRHENGSAS